MRLISFDYSEYLGEPQEWSLVGLQLGARNLVVGKNSAGKSRAVSVIQALAQYLLGERPPSLSGHYDVHFEHDGTNVHYVLSYAGLQVTFEQLRIDNKELLTRGAGGIGSIFAEQLNDSMQFQSPVELPAASTRRDSIQHPFLDLLHGWAISTRFYQFGSSLGKERLAIFVPNGTVVDERDQSQVAGILRNALRDYGDSFIASIKEDMGMVGYEIDSVGLAPPISITFPTHGEFPGTPLSICVKESDLPGSTDHIGMSQGMYRVLALLIHVNYLRMRGSASCLIIDDIGEGLDFDRSCRLISLIRTKSETSSLQVILTTNDRFVMNEVPLDEWTILKRTGNKVSVINKGNAGALFEELRFTGMSNSALMELGLLDSSIH